MEREARHTLSELQQLQALQLTDKIKMTQERIRAWVNHFGIDGVYVSFSGGKDSTVLLHLARQMYPDMKAVFIDTGLEYPEIRDFVKSFDNVEWLKPKMNFRQVIEKYGYPFISKEVSECVQGARKYLTSLLNESNASTDRQTDRQTDLPYRYCYDRVTGQGNYKKKDIIPSEIAEQAHLECVRGGNDTSTTTNAIDCLTHIDQTSLRNPTRGGMITSIKNSEELASILNKRMLQKSGGANQRLAIMLGMLTNDKNHPIKANIPSKDRSIFSMEKYKFLLDAPFNISNMCCNVMKKDPAHRYAKETGRKPMTAQMAAESRLRTQKWLKNGCNGFDLKTPISNPMAFWTEQDILHCIKINNIPICSVYGKVVSDDEESGQINLNQMMGMELLDLSNVPLHTTGCNRTGCMFCGYGCHLEKPGQGRFKRMKITHPKIYEYIMKPWEVGGLNYKEVIDWINEHGNLNIRY